MTPADELHAAADRIDRIAAAAGQGPWERGDYGDYGWTVCLGNSLGGSVIETADSEQGQADAAWIVLMQPATGRLIAQVLRGAAAYCEGIARSTDQAIHHHPTILDALDLARRINTTPEGPTNDPR